MIKGILKDCYIDRIMVSQAAGTSDTLTSAAVDMSGYEGAIFIVELGTVTSTGTATMKLQQSTDNSSYADLASTGDANTGDSSSDLCIVSEIINPQERYLKCVITRATANVEIDSVLVIKFGAKALPVTQSSDVDSAEQHIAPAEGTA